MIQKMWVGWNRFWFEPAKLLNLAVFRIIFGFTLLCIYSSRQADVQIFYTDEGLLPKSMALKVLIEGFRPPFVFAFWSDAWVPFVHFLFLVLLLLISIGFFSRIMGFLALYIHLAFLYRNYGVAFGADQIASCFLLYLSFTQADARLSIRSWWRARHGQNPLPSDLLTSLFSRLIQIQLCVIYVYSGMEKLRGSTWWDGTAVWSVLANSQMVIADFTWMRHLPLLIVLISFSTILFELYFPVLVWVQPVRKYVLLAGLFFHLGIAFVMALWTFAAVMISSYVLFIPEARVQAAVEALIGRIRSLVPN